MIVLVGGPSARAAAGALVEDLRQELPGAPMVEDDRPETWPFRHPLVPDIPAGPVIIRVDHAECAFENRQSANALLVTTQAQYLMTEWERALDAHGQARLVATISPGRVPDHARDVLRRRGVFARAEVRVLDESLEQDQGGRDDPPAPFQEPDRPAGGPPLAPPVAPLVKAFRSGEPAERLRLCIEALDLERSPGALVAAASVCMEVHDLPAAARDLDEAIEAAPEWAAARFERGKLWLRLDDMEQAAAAFRAATERLPAFGPAWANLGATLGELDRPAEALAAFERALEHDPESPQAINNVGVVSRELGQLPESEAAFRRVIELTPDLAFGHYNLGHTLFLQGRYHAALSAYAEGQARDPERNAVQATRLAMCRLATGDAAGSLAELRRAMMGLTGEMRRQVLADTSAIAWALITHKPHLAGWAEVHQWLSDELVKLG
jgi:Tfp pilus assembly protein PilF